MADLIQTPRGTKDILPDDQAYWQWIVQTFTRKAELFGFSRIETPTFEYQHIFTKGVGQTSDIVEKEMFQVKRLTNNDDNEISEKEVMILRPEGTAAIARAYVQHGMHTWTQPVKLYYIESMFRYDRPQKGRYREHHQLGLEYFGDTDPSADATIIIIYWQLLQELKLTDGIVFNLNSLGDETCRPKYRKKLRTYFEPYKDQLCNDCQRRLATNPLRILDCKEEACRSLAERAPVLLNELCATCKKHLATLLEYLDELEIPYNLVPMLVRGLDYYQRTVFEVVDTADSTRQSSISGGGRYDGLVKLYGGNDTPAVGTGIGIERLIEKLQEREIVPPEKQLLKITVIPLGDKAKKLGLKVIHKINQWNYGATGAFSKESLRSQLKYADKMGTPYAVIIGSREVFDNSLILRDMKTGVQDTLPLDRLESALKERFG